MFGDGEGDRYTWDFTEENVLDMPNDDGHPDDPWWRDPEFYTDKEIELLRKDALSCLNPTGLTSAKPDKIRVETRFNTPYCFY